jgi:hypothetical protein
VTATTSGTPNTPTPTTTSAATATATAPTAECVGDCDGNGEVAVHELDDGEHRARPAAG